MKIKIKMDYKKSTKNTHVYGEQDSQSPIQSLYVKRSAFDGDAPKVIVVEIGGNDE